MSRLPLPLWLPVLALAAAGLWNANNLIAELRHAPWDELDEALTRPEAERIERHLEATRPGASALFERLRRELPPDALVFGFHPLPEDGIEAARAEDLTLLGELQLLLYPIELRPMPKLGPDFVPPAGLELERLFALELDFAQPALLAELLQPVFVLEHAGRKSTLWRFAPPAPEARP